MRPEFVAYTREHAVLEVEFNNTRRVCHRCRQRIDNVIGRPHIISEVEQNVRKLQVPDYTRAPNTPGHCIFNTCQNTTYINTFINEYVILHLGVDRMNRNDVLEKNLTIPRGLFGIEDNNKAIGTYIYINKSSNFLFHRLSYSLHKFQNLLKPFLLVCSNGYIIDVLGPYAAPKTEANIMNDGENPLHCFPQPNDVFVLDRGFRDSLEAIESYVPPSKDRWETQLTTEQGKEARSVSIWWVVEMVKGRFKRDFKLLRQKYFNKTLPKMFIDFKIVAAMLNNFHITIDDNIHAEATLNIIRERIDSPNLLYDYLERKHLNRRRADFQRIERQEIQNFPLLTKEQIITC